MLWNSGFEPFISCQSIIYSVAILGSGAHGVPFTLTCCSRLMEHAAGFTTVHLHSDP